MAKEKENAMIYINGDGTVRIEASVGARGAAILEKLGFASETSLEWARKRVARNERLSELKRNACEACGHQPGLCACIPVSDEQAVAT